MGSNRISSDELTQTKEFLMAVVSFSEDTQPCNTRPEWNVNGYKRTLSAHAGFMLYTLDASVLMSACNEKTSEIKRGTVQALIMFLLSSERRCASRPQAGEHPFGSRFERKGKNFYFCIYSFI